jgi:hypothetical protein
MNNAASSPLYVENPLLNGAQLDTGRATVLYLRVSSVRQVGRDCAPEGISIPAQREACRRKAEQLGLTIVGEYVEPGRSALEMSNAPRSSECWPASATAATSTM